MTGKKRRKRIRTGFTMVELMAMLIIIGLLATVAVKKVADRIAIARITTTKASLKILHDAVNEFRMDTGQYPSEDTGLLDLVEQPMDIPPERWPPGGYLETTDLPKDGWDNDFYYQLYPESGKPFVIISFGPDREEGTEDDLYSTDAS
ncbi:MAG: type II secretion system major pseudopilin GspG [Phycisphaerales bacterium]|nr:MAG: type II secretion system major pseudopilin GspG [Phycisphaerales bacterium]